MISIIASLTLLKRNTVPLREISKGLRPPRHLVVARAKEMRLNQKIPSYKFMFS